MASAFAAMRTLCLPSAMCGPFCSVPPVGHDDGGLSGGDGIAHLVPRQLLEEHRVRRLRVRAPGKTKHCDRNEVSDHDDLPSVRATRR